MENRDIRCCVLSIPPWGSFDMSIGSKSRTPTLNSVFLALNYLLLNLTSDLLCLVSGVITCLHLYLFPFLIHNMNVTRIREVSESKVSGMMPKSPSEIWKRRIGSKLTLTAKTGLTECNVRVMYFLVMTRIDLSPQLQPLERLKRLSHVRSRGSELRRVVKKFDLLVKASTLKITGCTALNVATADISSELLDLAYRLVIGLNPKVLEFDLLVGIYTILEVSLLLSEFWNCLVEVSEAKISSDLTRRFISAIPKSGDRVRLIISSTVTVKVLESHVLWTLFLALRIIPAETSFIYFMTFKTKPIATKRWSSKWLKTVEYLFDPLEREKLAEVYSISRFVKKQQNRVLESKSSSLDFRFSRGFKKGVTTLDVVTEVLELIDRRVFSDLYMTDIKGAFDSISPDTLLNSLDLPDFVEKSIVYTQRLRIHQTGSFKQALESENRKVLAAMRKQRIVRSSDGTYR
jgi:hypothetical protein